MASIGISPAVNLHWHKKNSSQMADGYRLYVYENETTTPAVCYSDYKGIGEHTNPIIIQPDGKVPGEGLYFLYEEDVTANPIKYTLVLHDDNGSPIETTNGITAGGGGGATGQTIQSDWDDIDSTSAAYIRNKPDVITDDERDKLGNVPDDTNAELSSKIPNSEKGVAGGVATLDGLGKVPESQLSGVVAEVKEVYIVGVTEFANDWLSETEGGSPLSPNDSTIYYILTVGAYENKQYRWGGSSYIELSASLTLGTGANNAYYGDKGEVAYQHTSDTNNPHNVSKAQVGLDQVDNTSDTDKPVSDATQTEIDNINTALDGTVKTTGDQVINGVKAFNETPTFNVGANFNSYKLPDGAVTPNAGQMLKFPSTGNVLEWGDVELGDSGQALTIHVNTLYGDYIENPNPGSSWSGSFDISQNAGVVRNVTGDDNSDFDLNTGVFTAPEDGWYYVQAVANGKTGTSSFPTTDGTPTFQISTSIYKGNIKYLRNYNTLECDVNRSFAANSGGVMYLAQGSTLTGRVDFLLGQNITIPSFASPARIHGCNMSVFRIGKVDTVVGPAGPQGADGADAATGTPDTITRFGDDGVGRDSSIKNDEFLNVHSERSTVLYPSWTNSNNTVFGDGATIDGGQNTVFGNNDIKGHGNFVAGYSTEIVDADNNTAVGNDNELNDTVDSTIAGYNNRITSGNTDGIYGNYNNLDSANYDSHRNIFGENNDIPAGFSNCNFFGKYFRGTWANEQKGYGNYFGGQDARSIMMGRYADRNGYYPSGDPAELWVLSSVKGDDTTVDGTSPQGGELIWRQIDGTGSVGPQGPQGDQGENGVDGAKGATGDTGANGETGPAGADSTVPGPKGETGAQGSQGPQGNDGADSTVAGPQGAQGEDGVDGGKIIVTSVYSGTLTSGGSSQIEVASGNFDDMDIGSVLYVSSSNSSQSGYVVITALATSPNEIAFDWVDSNVASQITWLPTDEFILSGPIGAEGADGAQGAQGESGSSSIDVAQTSHGFFVPTSIYRNELNVWVEAKADNIETLGTHVVVEVTDFDNFVASNSGEFDAAGHGYTVDEYYYTSDVTAGEFTDTEPSLYSNPMFKVIDSNTLEAFQWRPAQTAGAVGQPGPQGAQGYTDVEIVTTLPGTQNPTVVYIVTG